VFLPTAINFAATTVLLCLLEKFASIQAIYFLCHQISPEPVVSFLDFKDADESESQIARQAAILHQQRSQSDKRRK
jgi:hypothetical protein